MPPGRSGKPKRRSRGPWVASAAIMVSDAQAAKKWYVEKLGLSVVQDGEHWITVGRKEKGGALHLCLASRENPLEPGNTGVLVIVDGDLRTECAKLRDRGVQFVHEPSRRPWGSWDATIRDPDGNEILLMDES